jgi:hypothetical protein
MSFLVVLAAEGAGGGEHVGVTLVPAGDPGGGDEQAGQQAADAGGNPYQH